MKNFDLNKLVVGDKVEVVGGYGPGVSEMEITRTTKTQVIVNDSWKFNKNTGKKVGDSGLFSYFAYVSED